MSTAAAVPVSTYDALAVTRSFPCEVNYSNRHDVRVLDGKRCGLLRSYPALKALSLSALVSQFHQTIHA